MNRRTLLAAVGACGGAAVAGCIDDATGTPGNGDDGPGSGDDGPGNGDETGRDDDSSGDGTDERDPGDGSGETDSGNGDQDCGLASVPLSELLTDDPGDGEACFEGAEPSLEVANEREEAVTATVVLEAGSEELVEETYDLEAGERAVESHAVVAADEVDVTVTVDGEDLQDGWDERSCRRHGVALTSEGLEVGWVEPIQGPGDTQHDCYPGSDLDLEVGNLGDARTITVTVADRCDGSTLAETFDLAADANDRLADALVSGGNYDVTVDVEDGATTAETFEEVCWGVSALVEEDGTVRVHQLEID